MQGPLARHRLAAQLMRLAPWRRPHRITMESAGSLQEALIQMLNARLTPVMYPAGLPVAEGIVFSKDRPMQLHALLESYFDQVCSPSPLHVIFRASSARFLQAYHQVIRLFEGRAVSFLREGGFRDDFLDVLNELRSPIVFFLVDDIVFIAPTDLERFARFDPYRFIPTLRMGTQLTACYTENRHQPLPPFLTEVVQESEFSVWQWSQGVMDWGYPLSVDGHFFSAEEMRIMSHLLLFHAPNTLESALQAFLPVFDRRFGVCYRTSRIVNIPINRVQNEVNNRFGNGDTTALLSLWEQGLEIDRGALYGTMPASVHQELPLTFKRRAPR